MRISLLTKHRSWRTWWQSGRGRIWAEWCRHEPSYKFRRGVHTLRDQDAAAREDHQRTLGLSESREAQDLLTLGATVVGHLPGGRCQCTGRKEIPPTRTWRRFCWAVQRLCCCCSGLWGLCASTGEWHRWTPSATGSCLPFGCSRCFGLEDTCISIVSIALRHWSAGPMCLPVSWVAAFFLVLGGIVGCW